MNIDAFNKAFENETQAFPWFGHWYANTWHKPTHGDTGVSLSPNTGQTLLEFQVNKSTVEDAIVAAKEHCSELAEQPLESRMQTLERLREEISRQRKLFELSLQHECGKPAWEARLDVDHSLDYLEQVTGLHDRIHEHILTPAHLGQDASFSLHPVGVCVAYLPFSTPLTSFISYFAAARIAGCPIVLFSSKHTTLISSLIAKAAEMIPELGSGLGVIFSGFDLFKFAASAPQVKAVLYNGSYEHCDEIYRDIHDTRNKRLLLQSGGKNSILIHSTADIPKAVSAALYGTCKSAGQLCSSTSRAFVYRSLMPEFVSELKNRIALLKIGRTDVDGAGPSMGPLFSKRGVDKFLRFQTMANRDAVETIAWGRTLESEDLGNGSFVTPGVHILDKYDPSSAYQGNVLFCPDLAIYCYDVLDDAINQINHTQVSISVSFFGEAKIFADRRRLFKAQNLLSNAPTVEPGMPFPLAGRNQHSKHRFQGMALAWYLSSPQALLTDLEEGAAEPHSSDFPSFYTD